MITTTAYIAHINDIVCNAKLSYHKRGIALNNIREELIFKMVRPLDDRLRILNHIEYCLVRLYSQEKEEQNS